MDKKVYWVTTILSSLTMAIMMSGIISGYKMGFSADWPPIWLQSFLIGFPCALMLSLTVLPQVRKLAEWACKPNSKTQVKEQWCEES